VFQLGTAACHGAAHPVSILIVFNNIGIGVCYEKW